MRIFAKLWPGLYIGSAGGRGRFEQGVSISGFHIRSAKSFPPLQTRSGSYAFSRSLMHGVVNERIWASRK